MQKIKIFFPWLAAVIFLLSKVFFMDVHDLAIDEPFSVFFAQQDKAVIIDVLLKGNNPPLYELFLSFWVDVFGVGIFSVRLPSLIFTSFAVVYFLKFFSKLMDKHLLNSLVFFMLLLFSNYLQYFAFEARGYALLLFLTVASFYHFLQVVVFRINTKLNFIFYLIFTLLIIYTHYFGFFVLTIQLSFLLTHKGLRIENKKRLIFAVVFLLLAYSPILFQFVDRFSLALNEGTWVMPTENLGHFFDVVLLFFNDSKLLFFCFLLILLILTITFILKLFSNFYIKSFLILIVSFYLLVVSSAYFYIPVIWKFSNDPFVIFGFFVLLGFLLFTYFQNRSTIALKLVVLWWLLPFCFMFLISLEFFPFTVPMFLDRYLIFTFPAFLFTIFVVFNSFINLFKGVFKWFLIAVLLLLYLHHFTFTSSNDRPVSNVVKEFETLKTPETLALIAPESFKYNFNYYYNIGVFSKNDISIEGGLQSDNIYFLNDKSDYENRFYLSFNRILFLDAGVNFLYPNNQIFEMLNNHYSLANQIQFGDHFRIFLFTK